MNNITKGPNKQEPVEGIDNSYRISLIDHPEPVKLDEDEVNLEMYRKVQTKNLMMKNSKFSSDIRESLFPSKKTKSDNIDNIVSTKISMSSAGLVSVNSEYEFHLSKGETLKQHDVPIFFALMSEGRINDLQFSKIMEVPENFEIISKNLYHQSINLLYEKPEQKHATMNLSEFKKVARYINLNLFKKLLNAQINFEQLKLEIFQDKEKLRKLCLDNLKKQFGEELFTNNEGIKQLIDDVCKYRKTKDRLEVILNDPLLKIGMK